MNLQIFYNGNDVTEKIEMQDGILTDRYGGLLDSIKLVINDADLTWLNKLSKGDEISVLTDGYKTGSMYISNTSSITSKSLSVDAVSLKPSKKDRKSRIWRYVRLFEILNDCAKGLGLSLKTYGITDFTYESLAQIYQTDLEFVAKICLKEGYSVKVDDNSLIVFNEYHMENQDTKLTIKPDDVDSNYYFEESDSGKYSVTVCHYDTKNGLIEQTAVDKNILGASEIIKEKVTSYDEAQRYAKGYLRNFNKQSVTGHFVMPYNPSISAGTVFFTEGFGKYDNKYVVHEVSHNIKKEKTSLKFRKVLGY